MAKTVFGKIFKGIGNAVKAVAGTALNVAGSVGGAILPGAAGRLVQGGAAALSGAITGKNVQNPMPPNAPPNAAGAFPDWSLASINPAGFSGNVPANFQASGPGFSIGGKKTPWGLIAGIGGGVLVLILLMFGMKRK